MSIHLKLLDLTARKEIQGNPSLWFLEEDVTNAYHQLSAELVFRRTIEFLKSHLE